MPEPRRSASILARPIGTLSGAPRFPLGDYEYRGWEFEPIRGEKTPGQIVAGLHREMARSSADLAALVAAFDALPPRPAAWDADDDEPGPAGERGGPSGRRARWRELRTAGTPVAQARSELGVSRRTAVRYERWLENLEAAS